jgi:hypothetical protein
LARFNGHTEVAAFLRQDAVQGLPLRHLVSLKLACAVKLRKLMQRPGHGLDGALLWGSLKV